MTLRVTLTGSRAPTQEYAGQELTCYLAAMGVEQADIVLGVDPAAGLSDEGYRWDQAADQIRLTAGGDLGLLFGVYALLRDAGGCRFSGLGPDGEYVPQRRRLEPLTATVREPKLWYRGMQFSNMEGVELLHQQIDWMAKNGFNFATLMLAPDEHLEHRDIDPATGEPVGGKGTPSSGIVEAWADRFLLAPLRQRSMKLDVNHHNFRLWLPPAEHMQAHPEWYALHQGQRGSNLQQLCICTSNPHAVDALIESIRRFLRRRPDVRIVGVIPEDGNGMCQCEACRALDVNPRDSDRPHNFRHPHDENRSLADRYARLLNSVASALAAEFPHVLIGAAAYVDAQWPARDIPLHPNITLWFATYWRDACRPLRPGVDSHINSLFVDLLQQWKAKLTAPLIEYAYYMGMGAQRGLPYPMARVMCDEWPDLKAIGVQGATVQCLASCHEAYGLNLAAFARSAWEDHVNYDALLRDYLLGMFGAAAPALEPVYRALDDAATEIARMPQGTLPGGLEKGVMQPNAENAAFFLQRAGDLDAAMNKALSLCQQPRETRQVRRLARYVDYWRLAAAATDADAVQRVIAFLQTAPRDGWFSETASRRWKKLARSTR